MYKVRHSRGLRHFPVRRVINKHVKFVQRFVDRECKCTVSRGHMTDGRDRVECLFWFFLCVFVCLCFLCFVCFVFCLCPWSEVPLRRRESKAKTYVFELIF